MDMGVSLPTWLGSYQKAMDGRVKNLEKGDENAAIDYADKVVRQTQGVGKAKDLALVQQGSEAFKLFTMFYSYFSVLFNQFAKSTHQFQLDRNIGRYASAMLLLWVLPAALSDLMLGRAPSPDDEPEEWLKWFVRVELGYPFQTIILLRDVINGMGKYGYEPSAAFDAFEAVSNLGKGVGAVAGGTREATRADVRNLVQTIGYAFHLPSRQAWLTMEYLHDWLTGEVEPEHPAELIWRAAVTGKPRE
jgi:hypothetical protein